jgi:hypothetical protein
MHLSKTFVASLFCVVAVLTRPSLALEGEEELCPAFANQTEFPSCEDCVSSSCGFAVDDGDCVKDCAAVTDTECFSLATSNTTVVADICALASAGGGGGEVEEEEMCATFETSGETPTCETCVEAGCGWTSDDGDCLKNCGEVNDGAACVSKSGSQTAASVCEAGAGEGGGGEVEEEEMCAAFETSGATPTCETCVEAGCGWTSDDGDCLKNCGEVNDGAACVSMSGSQTAASVCGASGGGGSSGGTSGAVSTVAALKGAKAFVTLTLSAAAALFV